MQIEICPEMHALEKMAKMAEMAIKRQIVNNILIKMAKGPFWKRPFWGKWRFFENGRARWLNSLILADPDHWKIYCPG